MNVIEPRVVYARDMDYLAKMKNYMTPIENSARICYNSTDKLSLTFESSKEWVEKHIIALGHNRALEFGTIYLTIPWYKIRTILWYKRNHYSRMTKWGRITTNYRVIHENNRHGDLRWLRYTLDHAKRKTIIWNISRGIADEFRTHCSLSSLMQSTRYCNMVGKKMGEEITFVRPTFCEDKMNELLELHWVQTERKYRAMLKDGCTAEQAREVLPLSVSTILIQCGFDDDWERFFALRAENTEHNHPHPDAQHIASKARELINKYNIW